MKQKEKESIKRIVGEGLGVILGKLQISKPSSKVESSLKKYSKKLTTIFKGEVKKQAKEKNKNSAKDVNKKKVKSPDQSVAIQ
jgi:hypothetical protein